MFKEISRFRSPTDKYLKATMSQMGPLKVNSKLRTLKPVLSGHSKKTPKYVFKIQVKSLAGGAFCNAFYLHKTATCLYDLCYFYFGVVA